MNLITVPKLRLGNYNLSLPLVEGVTLPLPGCSLRLSLNRFPGRHITSCLPDRMYVL